jgi:hypothetical protein
VQKAIEKSARKMIEKIVLACNLSTHPVSHLVSYQPGSVRIDLIQR